MKAVVYTKYGLPEVLEMKELPQPQPGPREVLVRVHAASVNSWDWDMLTGKPRLYRLLFGLFKPRLPILGADIAGIVESVGAEVNNLKPGDEVLGDLSPGNWGGFAEYVNAKEELLVSKPAGLSFAQAAALPQAGALALQGLRKAGTLTGRKVLINGAGGGAGTFAIQLAKLAGAEVTGVDAADKAQGMIAVGADHVIDYLKQDFTHGAVKYDVIIDVVATHPMPAIAKVLNKHGSYVMIGGKVGRILQLALGGGLFSLISKKRFMLMAHQVNRQDITHLCDLCIQGKLTPIIDTIYPLNKTRDALAKVGAGRALGKVLVNPMQAQ